MRKILFGILILICGCTKVGKNCKSIESNGIIYFKDVSTGLCFGKVDNTGYGGFVTTSITCVPCDSLKKLGL